MNKGTSQGEKKQDSRELKEKCWEFLQPFLEQLHGLVDRRIVKTLLDLVMVILINRNRNTGLLLSELGGSFAELLLDGYKTSACGWLQTAQKP